ncbi:hypothetical protein EOD40_14235 [Flavobacterium sufflavum]|uniref:Uncharacterized protein n=1 Tax=Flavobacterium sufflavum TaxID=1921138 RepID=A0A3S2ULN6_9FLAO|nr:hypothetical protein [Flavobacterium sufflavum]RVT73399.1 hypothetical protein EOD40_14235 [Flavobacterium sufflavum]
MKYFSLIIVLFFFACGNKEDILLPKSNTTVISDVQDHSPIYIFFRIKDKDTLAEVNRKNSIITTNWIFNIDSRLPLRLVIPEVMKLQDKKRKEKAHKNEKAENYYSYADSIKKNMAFIPFTKVDYSIGKPKKDDFVIYFKKGTDLVSLNGKYVKKIDLLQEFFSVRFILKPRIVIQFDKNMSYGEYIQNKILVRKFDLYNTNPISPKEFIF